MNLIDSMLLAVSDEEKNSKEDVALVLSYLPQIQESLQNQTKSWNMLKSFEQTKETVASLFEKKEKFVDMLMIALFLLMLSSRKQFHRW